MPASPNQIRACACILGANPELRASAQPEVTMVWSTMSDWVDSFQRHSILSSWTTFHAELPHIVTGARAGKTDEAVRMVANNLTTSVSDLLGALRLVSTLKQENNQLLAILTSGKARLGEAIGTLDEVLRPSDCAADHQSQSLLALRASLRAEYDRWPDAQTGGHGEYSDFGFRGPVNTDVDEVPCLSVSDYDLLHQKVTDWLRTLWELVSNPCEAPFDELVALKNDIIKVKLQIENQLDLEQYGNAKECHEQFLVTIPEEWARIETRLNQLAEAVVLKRPTRETSTEQRSSIEGVHSDERETFTPELSETARHSVFTSTLKIRGILRQAIAETECLIRFSSGDTDASGARQSTRGSPEPPEAVSSAAQPIIRPPTDSSIAMSNNDAKTEAVDACEVPNDDWELPLSENLRTVVRGAPNTRSALDEYFRCAVERFWVDPTARAVAAAVYRGAAPGLSTKHLPVKLRREVRFFAAEMRVLREKCRE